MRIITSILKQWPEHSDRLMAVDDSGEWSSRQIMAASRQLAGEISRRSTRPRIGILLPTCASFQAAIIACWRMGRTIVPLHQFITLKQLRWAIEHAELDLIVTTNEMSEMLGPQYAGVQRLHFDLEMVEHAPTPTPITNRPDSHVAAILYTASPSGLPRGVQLTVGNLDSNVRQCLKRGDFVRSDRFLGVLPQFHGFGLTVNTLVPMMHGCLSIYTAKFRVSPVLELIRRYRPTVLMAVPHMFRALAQSATAESSDIESLRHIVSGGAPLSDAIYDKFCDRFGRRLCEGYGLTEISPVANWTLPHEERRGTVGRPLDGIDQIIVDPISSKRLETGCRGEIRIRGESVTPGYFKDPEATAAAFDSQGFFRTGDVGYLSDNGFLYITGRIKDMMIIMGENVFPREIEEILKQHPAVSEAVVAGTSDPSRGESPVAFVELNRSASVTPSDLREWCNRFLVKFKVPSDVRIMEAIPRSAEGGPDRRRIRSTLQDVFREAPDHDTSKTHRFLQHPEA